MAVIKHSLEAKSSVQCMNIDEWDKYCQPLLDAPYHADYAAIHHRIGEKTCQTKQQDCCIAHEWKTPIEDRQPYERRLEDRRDIELYSIHESS